MCLYIYICTRIYRRLARARMFCNVFLAFLSLSLSLTLSFVFCLSYLQKSLRLSYQPRAASFHSYLLPLTVVVVAFCAFSTSKATSFQILLSCPVSHFAPPRLLPHPRNPQVAVVVNQRTPLFESGLFPELRSVSLYERRVVAARESNSANKFDRWFPYTVSGLSEGPRVQVRAYSDRGNRALILFANCFA